MMPPPLLATWAVYWNLVRFWLANDCKPHSDSQPFCATEEPAHGHGHRAIVCRNGEVGKFVGAPASSALKRALWDVQQNHVVQPRSNS